MSEPVKVPLSMGYFATVDSEDFERVSKVRWHAKVTACTVYARRAATSKYPYRYLHHAVLEVISRTDHRDGNGLNNQRDNLRLATRAENHFNLNKRKTKCSSRFKGVTWNRARNKWQAYLTKNGRFILLGLFRDERDAATAYNFGADLHFGEFAKFNTCL